MTVDTAIREKTPLEQAAERRRQQAADSRHAAIKAMANALGELGYTRDHDDAEVTGPDAMYAAGHMLRSLNDAGDDSFSWDFITEPGGRGTNRSLIGLIADQMIAPSHDQAKLIGETIPTLCRWYGESFIREALDMLDSASEIQRDREVDMAIDERKSA